MSNFPLSHDDYWTGRDGVVVWLEEMDRTYQINLLRFLRRRARLLQSQALSQTYALMPLSESGWSDGIEAAFEAWFAELDRPAEEWLEMQPLVIRLRELIGEVGLVDRTLVRIHNRSYPLRRRLGAS